MNTWAALFAFHILPLRDMFTESVWEVNRMLLKFWCLSYTHTRGHISVLKSHTNFCHWNVLGFFFPKMDCRNMSFSHLAGESMMEQVGPVRLYPLLCQSKSPAHWPGFEEQYHWEISNINPHTTNPRFTFSNQNNTLTTLCELNGGQDNCFLSSQRCCEN